MSVIGTAVAVGAVGIGNDIEMQNSQRLESSDAEQAGPKPWSCYQICLLVSEITDGLVIIAGIASIIFGTVINYSPFFIGAGIALVIEGAKAMGISMYCSTLLSLGEQIAVFAAENDNYKELNTRMEEQLEEQRTQIDLMTSANEDHERLNQQQANQIQHLQSANSDFERNLNLQRNLNQTQADQIDKQSLLIKDLEDANNEHTKLNREQESQIVALSKERDQLSQVQMRFSGTLADFIKTQQKEEELHKREEEFELRMQQEQEDLLKRQTSMTEKLQALADELTKERKNREGLEIALTFSHQIKARKIDHLKRVMEKFQKNDPDVYAQIIEVVKAEEEKAKAAKKRWSLANK